MKPVTNENKEAVVQKGEQVNSKLRAAGIDVFVHQAVEVFGGGYELRMNTSGDKLTPDQIQVLADEGLGVEALGQGTWQLTEEVDDNE